MNFKIEMIEGDIDSSFGEFAKVCIHDTKLKHLGIAIDPKVIADTLSLFAKDSEKVFLLAKVDEKTVGIFLGGLGKYPFTEEKMASELYFNVLPEYRGNGIGQYLIKDFEIWAKQRGCRFIISRVNELASSDSDSANRRLDRDGFMKFSTDYFKEI